jgi:hypothetical protein
MAGNLELAWTSGTAGGAVAGAVVGFTVVWMAAAILIWIIKGFLTADRNLK